MDPLGMINGPNMYQYVFSNPMNYYDPTGRNAAVLGGAIGTCVCPGLGTAIGFAIGATVTGVVIYCVATGKMDNPFDRGDGDDGDGEEAGNGGKNDRPDPLGPLPTKDLRKAGNDEVDGLKKHGFDIHDLKDFDSKRDLYRDKDGNWYVGNKDGTGEADPLGPLLP